MARYSQSNKPEDEEEEENLLNGWLPLRKLHLPGLQPFRAYEFQSGLMNPGTATKDMATSPVFDLEQGLIEIEIRTRNPPVLLLVRPKFLFFPAGVLDRAIQGLLQQR